MNKKYFLLCWSLLLLAFSSPALAQQTATTDLITLKNGRTVRGKLVKIKAGNKLKLRASNGALYNLRFADIESMEKVAYGQENITEGQSEPPRKLRFTTMLEVGYAGGSVKQNIDDIELDFNQYHSTSLAHSINGVQFGQRFTAGLGTGLDFYLNGEYLAVPVFLDLRGTTKTAGLVKPEALFSAGYSFGFNNREIDKGLFASGGLGVKIKRYNNTALHVSLNYRHQQFSRTEDTYKKVSETPGPGQYVPATLHINTTFNQFDVRIGHSF